LRQLRYTVVCSNPQSELANARRWRLIPTHQCGL
jgi:hypothetical protein